MQVMEIIESFLVENTNHILGSSIEWDELSSIDFISIVVLIEEKFGCTIPDELLIKDIPLEYFVKRVENEIGKQ